MCLFLMCTRVAEVLAGLGASNAAFYGAPTTANSAHATEMQNAWLTDADAARLAAALPALRVLSLRAVVASEKSLSSVLFSALTSPTLQTLCLRHVRMCSKVLSAAVKRLEEVTPSASEGVSDAAAAAVDSGVGGAPAAPAAPAAAAATAAAVGQVNVHLRTLDLSFNHYEEVSNPLLPGSFSTTALRHLSHLLLLPCASCRIAGGGAALGRLIAAVHGADRLAPGRQQNDG